MSTIQKFYTCPIHRDLTSHDVTARFVEVERHGWKMHESRLICLRPDASGADTYVGQRVCGQTVKVRTIEYTDYHGTAPQSRCNGHCTSGKRRCDCQCQGLCHGRGECICNTEEGRRYRELIAANAQRDFEARYRRTA